MLPWMSGEGDGRMIIIPRVVGSNPLAAPLQIHIYDKPSGRQRWHCRLCYSLHLSVHSPHRDEIGIGMWPKATIDMSIIQLYYYMIA